MITTAQKELAQWALAHAKKCGAQHARIVLNTGSSSEYGIRNKDLEKLQQSSSVSLQITLFVDGRYGAVSSNRMEKEEIAKLIENGVMSTKLLTEDKDRQLPSPERYYKGNTNLQLFDNKIESLSATDKIAMANQVAAEVLGKDSRIISVSTSYSDGTGSSYTIDSQNFEGEEKSTYFSLSAEVSVKGEGEARPESYWYDSSLFFDKLEKVNIGKKAMERALQKIGQQKISSGQYFTIVDNMVAGQLFYPILNAMNGASIHQKTSFLMNKKGLLIVNPKLTLTDKPHLVGTFGARNFDGEGVATQEKKWIEDGKLTDYILNTYYANKLKMTPTISSLSTITFNAGNRSSSALLQSVKKGIFITGFNGGNCNPTTGDFSYGIEGFLIENGQLSQPISEMNITGNILVLWSNLVEIGNDPRTNSSLQIPTLCFDKISFSGI